MNKGYIKDHADRTWCRDPYSVAWRDAFVKEWHALWGSVPNTPISVACAKAPVMFQRELR